MELGTHKDRDKLCDTLVALTPLNALAVILMLHESFKR